MSTMLQVIGLCRFSYPTAGGSGFKLGRATSDSSHALYETRRLQTRLWLFRTLCLPTLLGQTDPDFRLIVLVGEGLPEFARKALDRMAAGHPQIIIRAEPEFQPHIDVCSRLLLELRDPSIPFVAEFRMDDDDGVGLSFVAELRRIFALSRGLIRREPRLEVDFCRGYALKLLADDLAFKPVVAAHWGVAQAFIQRSDTRRTTMNFPHYQSWRAHTAISCARAPMFIRCFHGFNDTGDRWDKLRADSDPDAPAQSEARLPELLARHFGLDLETARENLRESALAG